MRYRLATENGACYRGLPSPLRGEGSGERVMYNGMKRINEKYLP